jgi:hypothetical protein
VIDFLRHKCLAAIALASTFLIGACTTDDATDFCKNHYRFQADHRNSIAIHNIELSAGGQMQTAVSLPFIYFADLPSGTPDRIADIEQLLSAPNRVYDLETERDCDAMKVVDVRLDSDSIHARYESNCGEGNKVGQLNIGLFNAVPEIAEFEVQITTPAVGKHFVINRQCSAAIFRFNPH